MAAPAAFFHARAENIGHGSERSRRRPIGYVFNASADDVEQINQQLTQARAPLVGGVAVDAVDLKMGVATLQLVETDARIKRTAKPEEDWTRVLIAGRDASARLRPRTPRDVAADERRPGSAAAPDPKNKEVFIVHGHDHEAMHSVARLLQQLQLTPVILAEQSGGSRTVIEKLERHAAAAFAVVLLTPDDAGRAAGTADEQPRARQNVIFELGFFAGRLGRNRVCALVKGQVEIPSDWHGVLQHSLDAGNGWQLDLARELRAAGFEIDLNLL
ncbi:MAG TPA: nucleotide-binding protein [Rubrivivax sp.]|nr:nucleotide-binding protein [Rubrivivax sp.]